MTKRVHLSADILFFMSSDQLSKFIQDATGRDLERAIEEKHRRMSFKEVQAAIEEQKPTSINLNVTEEQYAAMERIWNARMDIHLSRRDQLRKEAGLDD